MKKEKFFGIAFAMTAGICFISSIEGYFEGIMEFGFFALLRTTLSSVIIGVLFATICTGIINIAEKVNPEKTKKFMDYLDSEE